MAGDEIDEIQPISPKLEVEMEGEEEGEPMPMEDLALENLEDGNAASNSGRHNRQMSEFEFKIEEWASEDGSPASDYPITPYVYDSGDAPAPYYVSGLTSTSPSNMGNDEGGEANSTPEMEIDQLPSFAEHVDHALACEAGGSAILLEHTLSGNIEATVKSTNFKRSNLGSMIGAISSSSPYDSSTAHASEANEKGYMNPLSEPGIHDLSTEQTPPTPPTAQSPMDHEDVADEIEKGPARASNAPLRDRKGSPRSNVSKKKTTRGRRMSKRLNKRQAARAKAKREQAVAQELARLARENKISESQLLLTRPKKVRRPARFDSATPSRFCHVCSRTPKRVRLAVCSKIREGLCRKVVCEMCFEQYEFGNFDDAYDMQNSSWLCSHCTDCCPSRAQCATYQRINDKLRVKRLKAERPIRKEKGSASKSNGGGLLIAATHETNQDVSLEQSPPRSVAPMEVSGAMVQIAISPDLTDAALMLSDLSPIIQTPGGRSGPGPAAGEAGGEIKQEHEGTQQLPNNGKTTSIDEMSPSIVLQTADYPASSEDAPKYEDSLPPASAFLQPFSSYSMTGQDNEEGVSVRTVSIAHADDHVSETVGQKTFEEVNTIKLRRSGLFQATSDTGSNMAEIDNFPVLEDAFNFVSNQMPNNEAQGEVEKSDDGEVTITDTASATADRAGTAGAVIRAAIHAVQATNAAEDLAAAAVAARAVIVATSGVDDDDAADADVGAGANDNVGVRADAKAIGDAKDKAGPNMIPEYSARSEECVRTMETKIVQIRQLLNDTLPEDNSKKAPNVLAPAAPHLGGAAADEIVPAAQVNAEGELDHMFGLLEN